MDDLTGSEGEVAGVVSGSRSGTTVIMDYCCPYVIGNFGWHHHQYSVVLDDPVENGVVREQTGDISTDRWVQTRCRC